MLMVLNLHANFIAFGKPTIENNSMSEIFLRSSWEAFSLVAVNAFVMISGWFGIKSSLKGFCNFMWQVVYVVGLSVVVEILFFNQPISHQLLLKTFGLYGGGGWFVASYIALYITAPILNSYIKDAPTRSVWLLLAGFFSFEVIYGNVWVLGYISGGYSPFSFIGLYLLAGVLRRSKRKISPARSVGIFTLCGILNAVFISLALISSKCEIILPVFTSYTNPLVICGAASLLIAFADMSETKLSRFPWNKIIPWLSSSCFAVYLLHVGTPFAFKIYISSIKNSYYSHPGFVGSLCVVCIMLGVFFAAILIDKPRIWIWRHLLLPIFTKRISNQEKKEEAMIG